MFTHPKKFLHLVGSPIYIALKDETEVNIPESGFCPVEYIRDCIYKSLDDALIPVKENTDGSFSPFMSTKQKKFAYMLCCVDYSEVVE